MDSVDVVIPSRDESKIRPNLLKTLRSASWVNNIVIETSSPLSAARRIGALKCKTKWIAMFDDDVEIDEDWFKTAQSQIEDGVVAVSGMFMDEHPHVQAYLLYTYSICDPAKIQTSSVCNSLFLKSVFNDYYPAPIRCGEDNLLYNHVISKGRWVHFYPGHTRHWFKDKYSHLEEGRNDRKYGFITGKQFIRMIYHLTFRSIKAVRYSRTPRTVLYYWSWVIQTVVGYALG